MDNFLILDKVELKWVFYVKFIFIVVFENFKEMDRSWRISGWGFFIFTLCFGNCFVEVFLGFRFLNFE